MSDSVSNSISNSISNSNDLILIQILYYALFKKKIMNDVQIIDKLPINAFGVFTTIKRNIKLKKWPEDIHGCIGYWDSNYKKLNSSELYENLMRVAYDSVWSDSRRKYFTPIETDPFSIIEIDFMMYPIYEINKKTGIITALNKQFTNMEYGIIIQSTDGSKRATYLPNVFQNISWLEIIKSIKQKAGLTSNENYYVFAYKIKQIKTALINLLTKKLFSYMKVSNFTRFLIDNMNPKILYPFIYSIEKEKRVWNSNDDVRNIGLLGDVIKYYSVLPNIMTKSEHAIIMKKVINILNNIDNYSEQGLSFLGHVYKQNNNNSNNLKILQKRDQYCNKLISRLQTTKDFDFELPEILIGLNNANCKFKFDMQYIMFTYNDNIFKMNWYIQTIIKLKKILKKELIEILIRKINYTILNDVENIQTNYIAVAFEALCYVYSNVKNTIIKENVLFILFKLLFVLENRLNDNNLYTFLDKSVRTDITGHIINGYFELIQKFQIV